MRIREEGESCAFVLVLLCCVVFASVRMTVPERGLTTRAEPPPQTKDGPEHDEVFVEREGWLGSSCLMLRSWPLPPTPSIDRLTFYLHSLITPPSPHPAMTALPPTRLARPSPPPASPCPHAGLGMVVWLGMDGQQGKEGGGAGG